ncbi:hypothetical protein MHTCC0001_33950 [Flavobacteriaceae bacterium MHTCC 0001]
MEKNAQKFPSADALFFNDEKISFNELNQRVNKMAHYLSSQGIQPEQIIAISLDRSIDLVVAIFAILQCGAAYIPIDVKSPIKRIQTIIDDSKANFLISASKESSANYNTQHMGIEEVLKEANKQPSTPLNIEVSAKSTAYIIYTSGSTGTPKGVKVSHQNVSNLVHSMGKTPGINKNDKFFALSTIAFDAMVLETFLPILNGASVSIVDEETRLDGQLLLKKAIEEKITVLFGTPSVWQMLLDSDWNQPLPIKALTGGEALPMTLAKELLKRCDELWNLYGPTEATVLAFLKKISKDDEVITIGKPIDNSHAYILDKEGNPINPGGIGELALAGDCVSLGYLNRSELTENYFIEDKFDLASKNKMYLSGDLGKLLKNGEVQCLGRKDEQVKVRGHRIELTEIETVLDQLPYVKKNAVTVRYLLGGEPKLVAYLQSVTQEQYPKLMRKHLEDILPEYMIPSTFIWLKEFPTNASGKIDKKKLPAPVFERPETAPIYKKPRTKTEIDTAAIWSKYLQLPKIGINDNFFEMGGTSLLTQKVASVMRKKLNKNISATKIYQFPTIAELSKIIHGNDGETKIDYKKSIKNKKSSDIAIIAMSGRFPGASSVDELWEVLKNGKETISFFSEEELDNNIPKSLRNDPLYVKARGTVPSAKEFDATFFGLNPKVAQAMDPQQRLFLEIAWEVLEESGHLPSHYKGSVGVYAGTGTNTYYINNVLPNKTLLNQVGDVQARTLNEKDYIATRTAYHLNLKGPAVSVHSACSTSLLAIAEAVEGIRNGQCDVALAGGSSLTSPINSGHLYQEGAMLSPDGHCRSFDKEGKGTIFSDGAGVVLLKSLEKAEKDGDLIYGVIKGVGLNNDGGEKGSFTAPSIKGQADAISRALIDAKVSPDEISYIEAHGTATPLGDPIEIEGLQTAFGKQNKNNYCAIGSIKSNMGHLTAAAGVAGTIKTILALHHQQIPPSLGFETPNPSIDFDNSPFFVNATLRPWDISEKQKRRAGISSFGVGGTNVHIIVEEYKATDSEITNAARPMQIIPWSAKKRTSLEKYGEKLASYIKNNNAVRLSDVASSLKSTRANFRHRQFILAKSNTEAVELLKQESTYETSKDLSAIPSELAFLFPGQGAQYLQMGKVLYEHEDTFKHAVDNCSELLKKDLRIDIREIIFPVTNDDKAQKKLKDTKYTQPALFVIEYALAKLWMSWGIKPTVFCGHSIGEFVGAHLAGVFSLEDALHLIATRGRLVSELPEGSMLSVRLSKHKLLEILPKNLSIAAVNSDLLCVASGEDNAIKNFAKILKEKEVPHRLLLTSHAFHSTMMDPVLNSFKEEFKKIKLSTPNLPIISTVTGTWLNNDEAIDPNYWTNHLRATVQFSDALDTILKLEDCILLEVGPGKALTTLARQKKAAKSVTVLSSLPIPKENESAYPELLNTLGNLWLNGLEPDWKAFYKHQSNKKLRLPSYAFDKKLCWIDPIKEQEYLKPEPKILKEHTAAPIVNTNDNPVKNEPMRKPIILNKISELIIDSSGIELEDSDMNHTFLELGLDSLILTQIALTCKKEFKIPITFRQLNENFNTPDLLASYLDEQLPADVLAPEPQHEANVPVQNINTVHTPAPQPVVNHVVNTNQSSALTLIAQQLQILGKQVELLQGGNVSLPNGSSHHGITNGVPLNGTTKTNGTAVTPKTNKVSSDSSILSEEEKKEHKKPFGASPKIEKTLTADLNQKQENFLMELTKRYNDKTIGSKNYAQHHRSHMSDPRVVTGFKPATKEMVYPLVIKKSSGNELWDLDDNKYIDTLNGFGSCIFGHQPDFIKEALHNQVESGYEVGPQHPLAGEVSELLCELTGHERSALCNTGSEAVLGAMRIARTVTGRSLIVAFSGAYHGINDEGLVRGSKKLRTFPAAAGIMSEAVQNMLILEYGTDESLKIIKEKADEIAAVLIEPVQSRRPEFQPVDFIKEVRKITKDSDSVLIFDEVITGFRMHLGGAQELFGVKADLATYGKVIGGGLPIGAIAGKKNLMDALDGGFWQYGDDSYPEVGVTYFAGTFVRHPLALAASKAALVYMKEKGPKLQQDLNELTDKLANSLNTEFAKRQLPIIVNHFGSLWRVNFTEELPYTDLLFVLLREKGFHIWDGFPCFITEAFTQEDITNLIKAILDSCDELISVDILPKKAFVDTPVRELKSTSKALNTPPIPGARLGQDEMGNPAWFLKDDNNKYVKIAL